MGIYGDARLRLLAFHPQPTAANSALAVHVRIAYDEVDPTGALSSASEKKDLALGYALWALSLVGICGVQRMYLGQFGLGIAMLFTFGFCGLAQLLDLLLLPDAVKGANQRLGFSGPEAAGPIPLSQSSPSSRALQPSSTTASSADDDELDQLLRQAEKSVSRTKDLTEKG